MGPFKNPSRVEGANDYPTESFGRAYDTNATMKRRGDFQSTFAHAKELYIIHQHQAISYEP
jgi:hypothetical protein